MKHTPGPWNVDDSIDSNGFFYYVLDGPADINGHEESKANCRLISAAPDLLEACKLAVEYFNRGGVPEESPTFTALRAAIAKAEAE